MGCLLICECVVAGFAWRYTDRNEFEKLVNKVYTALIDTAEKEHERGHDVIALGTLSSIQVSFVSNYVLS